jgi:hypothetical protein
MIFFLDEVIIDGYSCAGTRLFPLFQLAKFIIVLIQISVPFGLVIWGSLDWFKALIAHDEKEMRMKRKPFIQRVIAAIIVLVLPWLVQLIAEIFAGKSQTADFWTCYSEAKARIDFSSWQKQTIGNGGVIGGSSGAAVNSTQTKTPKVITGTSKSGSLANTTTGISKGGSSANTTTGISKGGSSANTTTGTSKGGASSKGTKTTTNNNKYSLDGKGYSGDNGYSLDGKGYSGSTDPNIGGSVTVTTTSKKKTTKKKTKTTKKKSSSKKNTSKSKGYSIDNDLYDENSNEVYAF